jgi:hypothetical protein
MLKIIHIESPEKIFRRGNILYKIAADSKTPYIKTNF